MITRIHEITGAVQPWRCELANGTANWINESCTTVGTGNLTLTGQNLGYNRFKGAVSAGTVWYEVVEGDNRECGLGTYDGEYNIERTTVHATLIGNIYDNSSPTPLSLNGSATVSCTLSSDAYQELYLHTINTSNPHEVTKAQVGLGNCDNTSDADKPISDATQIALDEKMHWKGTWVNLYNYQENDVVKSGTSTYVANTSTYEQPPHANWDLLNSDGVSDVTNIYDGLDSTAIDHALSANQGKVLYDMIQDDLIIDGGAAGSVYTPAQLFDGGNA